jgi:hypothetical protein
MTTLNIGVFRAAEITDAFMKGGQGPAWRVAAKPSFGKVARFPI